MEIERIIVDEIPTSCIKCNLYIDVDFSPYCPVLSRKFNLENEGYTARLDDCILQVEDECVWKKKDKATDDDYDMWVSPHYPHIYRSNLDFFPATFCRDCGKRIRYEEE